jgi:hypothetical protein
LNARCSPSIGWKIENCGVRPARSSTKANRATASRGPSSSIAWARSDRTYENQQHRASGLNLLVTAIILWNTRYLERAIAVLRQAEDVPDQLLAHLSPLGWEHVNLTGDYIWSAERPATENSDGFRPLRAAPDAARKAA